jgi:outer membrane murein-binding lipoprotein Lpp
MKLGIKIAAVAAVIALAGCTDLKPLQAQVDDLKTQVGKLSSDVAAHKASDDATTKAEAATDASNAKAAAAAQSTANQALAAAQAAQSGVDATNEKIDRMFKRSVSK